MRRLHRLVRWAIGLAGLLALSCGGPPPAIERPVPAVEEPAPKVVFTPMERVPEVRILILDPLPSIRVRIPSGFFMGEGTGETPLKRFESGGEYIVRYSGGKAVLQQSGKKVHESQIISIRGTGDGNIYINGKPYRGGFTFRTTQGGVIAINDVEIDDYLKGVLPAEIGYLRPDQYNAYLAQAVASRSYSLSKLDEKKMEIYDLKATIMDQVYRGVQGEHPDASRAVDETRGFVAFYNGAPARTYYSACCGGHTADMRIGWPWKEPHEYLYGGRDTSEEENGKSFCRRSPHFRWRVHWGGGALERILQETLPRELGMRAVAIGRLQDLKVRGIGSDGRVKAIEIVTDRGRHLVQGDRIRWVLLPKPGSNAILKSTLFKMDVKRAGGRVRAVDLVGGGNGHGIGLCQAGAVRMAEKEYAYEEILAHYYPGVTLVRYYP